MKLIFAIQTIWVGNYISRELNFAGTNFWELEQNTRNLRNLIPEKINRPLGIKNHQGIFLSH